MLGLEGIVAYAGGEEYAISGRSLIWNPEIRFSGTTIGHYMIEIRHAVSCSDIEMVKLLFQEYAVSLNVDLSFQEFKNELAQLPGDYSPPRGALLLAWDGSVALGCVGIRSSEWPKTAELKRLYVRPDSRRCSLGRSLSEAAIQCAREAGYDRIRLDTFPNMIEAQRLYCKLGFREIEPYRFNPIPGTRYLELVL